MQSTRASSRLLLRPPLPTDADNLFGIYGDPRTHTFHPSERHADIGVARTKLQGWIAHWQQHGFGRWAIAAASDPLTVIGYGGIGFLDYGGEQRLNLGYRFCVDAWGKGYATELAQAALHHALEELRQPAVFALVRPANKPSIRVLEKAGMSAIGTLDDELGLPRIVFRAQASVQLLTTRRTSSP